MWSVRAIWKKTPCTIQTEFLSKTLALMTTGNFTCLKILCRDPFLGFTVMACNKGTNTIWIPSVHTKQYLMLWGKPWLLEKWCRLYFVTPLEVFLYFPTNTFTVIGYGAGDQYQMLVVLSCKMLFPEMVVIRGKSVFCPFQRERNLNLLRNTSREDKMVSVVIGAVQLSTSCLGQSSEIPLQLKTALRDT